PPLGSQVIDFMDNAPSLTASRLRQALSVSGFILVGLVFGSLLGEFHPLLEGFSYFLFHYAILCGLLVPTLWLLKGSRWLIASLAVSGIICLMEVNPLPSSPHQSPSSSIASQRPCLTITHFNV